MRSRITSSLTRRLTAGFAALILILAAVQSVLLVKSFHEYSRFSIDRGNTHLTNVLKGQLERDAKLLGQTLSSQLDIPLYHLDLTEIGDHLTKIQRTQNLEYAYLFNSRGTLLHDGSSTIPEFGLPAEVLIPLQPSNQLEIRWQDDRLHLVQPVNAAGHIVGYLALAVDFSEALHSLTTHNQELQSAAKTKEREVLTHLVLVTVLLLLVALWIVYRFCHHLFKPLQALAEKSLRYGEGDRSIRFDIAQEGEIGQLGRALEQMRRGLEQSHHQTNQLAYLDNLTQLPNRHWFQQSLDSLIKRAQQRSQRLGVLFIDLDHFKEVNDTAGHEMGDLLLFEAAARLRNLLLELDLSDPDDDEVLLARLGGDEFVTLYPDLASSEHAAELARRIAEVLDDPFLIDGRYFRISSSIGITVYPDDGITSSEILKHADIAMYAAKQSGRNQYAFFSPQMNQQLHQRIEVLQGVRTALEQGHFHLEYQPVLSLADGRIRGAEALLRWHHPEQGLISPGLFIPTIEDSDLIGPVTEWVACQAVQDLLQLQQLKPGFSISINISGAALHQDSTRDFLTELKQREQVPDNCLNVELTETSMIRHLDDCRQTLKQWKAAGMNIWIDDFGTGYSSLSYLHQLPIDGLKIDRSFIRELKPGSSNSLVATIMTLAESMNLYVVAEGIETADQRDCLARLGSCLGQGFGLHRPMPLSALQQLLEAENDTLAADVRSDTDSSAVRYGAEAEK
ncbi:putative bifunctional diguanylate cyclase/phosphodiesterase [Marinobacterium sediminicola]|uniref:Diguanylate cyclase (GGDEF) domain-containing protein n=1 Tax=Marinobacterium sediminicola TaxID=518898 RepID=A0ABY1S2Z0_9GAMM|nr:EAL domain-containing protein [Marinobacterium sediminicola]ULG69284.1 EAL domain-containing protein [Marinobacterium sediminicola]SMR77633.1 diguanylate cyclase (GGDEF) domain-containing protein [Marinobacterium sediminicola]